MVIADVVLGSGVLLMGIGDGTLTAGTPLFASTVAPGNAPPAYALLAAPATASIPRGENDPFFALVFVNLQSGANAVFIPNIGSSAEPTAKLMPGTYSLTAHYSGDAMYAASVSSALNLTILPMGLEVSVASSANPSYIGEDVTLTATISGLFGRSLSRREIGSVLRRRDRARYRTGEQRGSELQGEFLERLATIRSRRPIAETPTNLAASGTVTQTVDAPIALDNRRFDIADGRGGPVGDDDGEREGRWRV